MKKNYLSLLLILFAIFFGFGQTTDLIISEYGEGSVGNSKYIELYNGTGATINLADYELQRVTNGGTWPEATLSLSGNLADGATYVVANNIGDVPGADLYDGFCSWNGDDAVGLALSSTGVLIDVIGDENTHTDPGTDWSVGTSGSTANDRLTRKSSVCSPNADWDASRGTNDANSEWTYTAYTTGSANAGHTVTCSSSNTSVEFVSTSSTLTENGTFIDICVGITNPSATNATTVDISLDGSSTATNGTDYDDGAGVAISFPVTLTFPAGSSANQCLTIHAENDAIIEGDETVVLNLTNANGGDTAALGTDVQHILTIDDDDDTFPADVVITEIMYNTQGTDDEWIEICNISGTAQVLNGYSIEVDNIVEYTFPSSGVIIADGDCITIALGTDGDGTFNDATGSASAGYCPFVPDYGISLTPVNSGQLPNDAATIEIIASDGTSVVDTVDYDDADGADGTGESLHVIDASQDNSDTGTNWQEVLNGGSYTGNTLISPCTPAGPEINLEGTTSGFPDITDGDTTPSTLDGTNFGGVVIGGTSTNTFRIENFAGTTDLTITSVTVASGDTGDFSITLLPSSPIAALGSSNFDVEFSPTAVGARTAVIEIVNNDSDENPYTFTVTGNGLCAASTITALPNSGPVGTIVTVTGTNLSTATASFNGVAATVNNISATEMEVIVPAGASSGNLEITDDLGCPGTTPFTVIESQISSCEGSGGTTPTDLFISEVTDANTGGLTYVEIYNGTGATVNLSSYSIQFFNNGNATENGGSITLANVNLASDDTYILAVSQGASCTGVTGGDGSLADQTGSGGINFVANGDDHIRLYDGSTHVDSWGEYLSDTWADALGIGSEGVVFTRDNDAANLPSTTFNLADWTYVDWASCADNDYSNIGTYDFSTGTPPTVNSISDQSTACNETTITVSATEGFSGGNTLNYVWYLYNPAQSASGWQVISNGGIYTTSATSPNLVISDAVSVSDFQFYCEVREDDANCYSASDAIQITVSTATWDGTNWTWNDGTAMNTVPTTSANVIINGDYDTANGGAEISFEACECLVNSGTLMIDDNTYVLVENDLTVDGNVVVKKDGAFVQVNDAAIVDGDVLTDKTKISVEKETAPLASQLEYTYWSSPVVGEVISDGLFEANPNRIYYFNGQNFRDSTEETNNDNTTATGQDDIDDDGNDWQFAVGSTVMSPGVGYAATHSPTGFVPSRYLYTFEGAFNNGVINVPIYRDDAELNDNNWNFIGNPYPSAIDADLFLAANASIDQTVGATNGAIFFWSHNTAANGNTNGNEELNYSQSDYAIINGSGETAGGDNVIPTRHIPSGQGFFVSMDNAATSTSAGGTIQTTDVVFNNSMRLTGNNNQFFRNANPFNKLWLNLTSDNGVFNQTLIAYVDGASDEDDGMYYDARKNQSSDLYSGIYTTLDASTEDKFAIQGKHPNSLDMDEVIQLGFNTVIDEATIYTIAIHNVEGQFMTDNDIFIIDYELNTIHNLKQSDYSFTSEVGEFNDRFDIVFRANALSIDDNTIGSNDLSITELSNGDVRIKVNEALTIEAVEILDLLGRRIYSLKGSSASEVYDLSKLSNAAYIAKVTLSNGQIISKKAIKQR